MTILTSNQAPVAAEPMHCVTCGTIRTGTYCVACGQKITGRHTLRSMLRNVLGRIFNMDGGFVHTAYRLTVRPGSMIRDYLRGATAHYTHPATYLLLALAIFVVITRTLIGSTGAAESDRVFVLLVIPFVAAAARVLFWRAHHNYAEHLIVVLYLSAHIAMLMAVLSLAAPFLDDSFASIYVGAAAVLGVAFFVWGYSRVFAERALLAAAGAMLALLLGVAGWLITLAILLPWLRT